jgi:hypothetical protein
MNPVERKRISVHFCDASSGVERSRMRESRKDGARNAIQISVFAFNEPQLLEILPGKARAWTEIGTPGWRLFRETP